MSNLAFQLKTHLYNMLVNNLTWEYMDQIEAWKLYIENVVDAAKAAADSHSTTLQAANAELREAEERSFAMAMFLLNLFVAPITYYVGAAIKIKWGAKFTATTRTVVERKILTVSGRYFKGFQNVMRTEIVEKNPIADSVLGDTGKATTGYVFDLTKRPLRSAPPDFKAPNISFVQTANSWQSMRTGLMASLFEQQQLAQSEIRSVANSIENDAVSFGQAIVDRLFKEQPNLKKVSGPQWESRLYLAGTGMINKLLNDRRAEWARRWFFYGNDPPKIKSNLSMLFERQIWSMWILEEELDVVRSVRGEPGMNRGIEMPIFKIKSKSGYLTTAAVRDRLVSLGMPSILPTLKTLSEIDVDLLRAADEVGSGELLARGDAEAKLRSAVSNLQNWAKNNVPQMGPLDQGVPRTNLPPIEQYAGRYGGQYQH